MGDTSEASIGNTSLVCMGDTSGGLYGRPLWEVPLGRTKINTTPPFK